MCFLKQTVNFKRSYAFAQIALFYALPMLTKNNLTHPKDAKLATLYTGNSRVLLCLKIMARIPNCA